MDEKVIVSANDLEIGESHYGKYVSFPCPDCGCTVSIGHGGLSDGRCCGWIYNYQITITRWGKKEKGKDRSE